MSDFLPYIEHGWKLCPLRPGTKAPAGKDWNRSANALQPDRAAKVLGAGLMHAYSGTMALDIDDYEGAAAWFEQHGVSLDELFAAPDAVMLASGRANRGKLLYACPVPMASAKVNDGNRTLLEFRCATNSGLSVQDVLPPSIHPETGLPYKWQYGDPIFGDWRALPALPEPVRAAWLAQLAPAPATVATPSPNAAPAASETLAELRSLLAQHNPDAPRDEWIRVGAALHHATGGSADGLVLWDEWSKQSEKYKGFADLEKDWRGFRSDRENAVTVGYLRENAAATVDEFTDMTLEIDPWAEVERAKIDRFRPVHVAEVAKRPPPRWLVKNLLPEADLAMMYGEPGAGKSFVALDLAFAVATGQEWAGLDTRYGPVVWVAAEAAGSIRLRAQAYARQHGMMLENANLWIVDQPLSLMQESDSEALAHVVAEIKPVLIVIDTLAAASGGANENSGEDMNIVLGACRRLHHASDATVLIVHHSGKDQSKGARGWSGMKAAMQTELCMKLHEDRRVMVVTKQRDAAFGDVYPINLINVMLDEDTDSCVVEVGGVIRNGAFQAAPDKLRGTGLQVWKALNDVALVEGGNILIEQAYAYCANALPPPQKGRRDQRKSQVKQAFTRLAASGYIEFIGDCLYLKKVYVDE